MNGSSESFRRTARTGALVILALLLRTPSVDAGAWQQRADYAFRVRYDPSTHSVSGTEILDYHHQGPDTLREIWLHLRHQSVRPGTRLDLARQAEGAPGLLTLDPGRLGVCRIDSVTADGIAVEPEVHEGMARLGLPRPLGTGDSVRIALAFFDRQPGIPAHSGYTSSEFTLGEWYPKACVLDESGWHLEPWLLRGEFYSDFGSYSVEFTLPARYRLAHTGVVLNEEEVLGAEERVRLAGLGERVVRVAGPSGADGPDLDRTWRLRAERVHDFALAGSADWTWSACRSGGARVSVYAPSREAGRADSLCANARDLLAEFSRRFGEYPYSRFDVVLTSTVTSSVEKPQMAWLVRERSTEDRSRRGFLTLAHEIAHQWFYGMVANDEAREAWMDEGVASYVALRAAERRFGSRGNCYDRGGPARSLLLGEDDFRSELYREALEHEGTGEAEIVAQPSDSFRSSDSYRRAVYGRASLLFLELEHRFGPDSMEKHLRAYAARWAWAHPRGRDLESEFHSSLGTDAQPFFDRWLRAAAPVPAFRPAPGDTVPAGHVRFDNTMARYTRRRADGPTVFARPSAQFNDLDGWALGAHARLEVPSGKSSAEIDVRLPRRKPAEGWLPQIAFSMERRIRGPGREARVQFRARRGEGRELLELGLAGAFEGGTAWRAVVERRNLFRPGYLRDPLAWRPGTQDAWLLSLASRGPGAVEASFDLRVRGSGPAGAAGFLRIDGGLRRVVAGRVTVRLSAGTFPRLAERSGREAPGEGPAPQELFQLAGGGPLAEQEVAPFRSHGPFGETSRISVPGGVGARGYAGRGISGNRYASASVELPLGKSLQLSLGNTIARALIEPYVFGDLARLGGSAAGPGDEGAYADGGLGVRLRALPWNTSVRLEVPAWLGRPEPGDRPFAWRWALGVELNPGSVAGAP